MFTCERWHSLWNRADEYPGEGQEHTSIATIRDREAAALLRLMQDFRMTQARRGRVTAVR